MPVHDRSFRVLRGLKVSNNHRLSKAKVLLSFSFFFFGSLTLRRLSSHFLVPSSRNHTHCSFKTWFLKLLCLFISHPQASFKKYNSGWLQATYSHEREVPILPLFALRHKNQGEILIIGVRPAPFIWFLPCFHLDTALGTTPWIWICLWPLWSLSQSHFWRYHLKAVHFSNLHFWPFSIACYYSWKWVDSFLCASFPCNTLLNIASNNQCDYHHSDFPTTFPRATNSSGTKCAFWVSQKTNHKYFTTE